MNRLLVLAAAVLFSHSAAPAAEFTVPIANLAPTVSGDRLVGEFDFGVRFSEISSLRLEFTTPDGFEGAATTTGNSSYSRSIVVTLHDPSESIQFADSGPVLPADGLQLFYYHLEPGETAEYRVHPNSGPGRQLSLLLMSRDFLMAGHGRVTITDFQHWVMHPLPDRIPTGSSSSYSVPGEILLARITLTGIAIPEPSTLTFLAIGCAAIGYWRRR